MAKKEIKYGVISIPKGTVICTMENGGDKDGKAIYRFSDSGKRTTCTTHALISDETVMKDLYGDVWAHIKEGWVKAGDKITWYGSYKAATEALSKKKTWRKTLFRIAPIIIIAALAGWYLYKRYKANILTAAAVPAAEPAIETTETIIPDEIPMD